MSDLEIVLLWKGFVALGGIGSLIAIIRTWQTIVGNLSSIKKEQANTAHAIESASKLIQEMQQQMIQMQTILVGVNGNNGLVGDNKLQKERYSSLATAVTTISAQMEMMRHAKDNQ